MKYVGLLVVLVIILYAFKTRVTAPNGIEEANREFAATAPATPASAPAGTPAQAAPPSSNLRRPIDNTRSVLQKVKGRNGDGEF
jgi:hypothetical protein